MVFVCAFVTKPEKFLIESPVIRHEAEKRRKPGSAFVLPGRAVMDLDQAAALCAGFLFEIERITNSVATVRTAPMTMQIQAFWMKPARM